MSVTWVRMELGKKNSWNTEGEFSDPIAVESSLKYLLVNVFSFKLIVFGLF